MIEVFLNHPPRAFLHFADIDQHSVRRIGWSGKNKVGDVIAAGTVNRSGLRSEGNEVLAIRPTPNKQTAGRGKFEPFADRQEHCGSALSNLSKAREIRNGCARHL